jgi:hypothetical protein
MTQQLTNSTPRRLAQTLEVAIGAWLHEKVGHTSSQKTRTAYQDTITAFRTLLQGEGLDLAWEPREGESEAHIRSQLALYAQAFASTRLPSSRHQGPIAPARHVPAAHHPQLVLPLRHQARLSLDRQSH